MARFEVIPEGTPWPSSDYVSAAVVPITPERLCAIVGSPLVRGVEEGLGPWEAVGLRLKTGALVELVRYQSKSAPQGFEVRIAGDADISRTLQDVIALLGYKPESLLWVSPQAWA